MANDKTNAAAPEHAGGRLERAGANATAQGRDSTNSTATVTIGCKLPHGLILDLTLPAQPPRRYRIKGRNSARIIGGYGITQGVPKSFWDEWLEKNRALSFVKAGLVFAEGNLASARDHAKDGDKLRTGLEPIDPNKPAAGITKDEDAPANVDSNADDYVEDEGI